jgi:hypothetical protein
MKSDTEQELARHNVKIHELRWKLTSILETSQDDKQIYLRRYTAIPATPLKQRRKENGSREVFAILPLQVFVSVVGRLPNDVAFGFCLQWQSN